MGRLGRRLWARRRMRGPVVCRHRSRIHTDESSRYVSDIALQEAGRGAGNYAPVHDVADGGERHEDLQEQLKPPNGGVFLD
jgi:hypothetical protein